MSKNARIVVILLVVLAVMVGLTAASVPLYRIFCQATGFNGTTQRAMSAPAQVKDREITVTFDANVDSSLPWDFAPEMRSMKVKLGQAVTMKYRAHNRGDKTLVGTATFNVQPDKAGAYFDKIQCFCFTKQVLKAGQTAELPVEFFIDPKMADYREADDVTDVTLSYTFYLAKDQSKAKSMKQSSAVPAATP